MMVQNNRFFSSLVVIISLTAVCYGECANKRQHVIFMMSDDMGWNDIGWNNDKIISPNLNKLAEEGVIFDNYYAQPMCTPTRATFLTGTYPHKTGFQQVLSTHPIGLPAEYKFLPMKMRELGYTAHLLGKWHLGICKEEYTPLGLGFNSHYGYYSHSTDWFTKFGGTAPMPDGSLVNGYDHRDNKGVVQDATTHLELLMRERAVEIIEKLPEGDNLFMVYFTGMPHEPMAVPEEYMDLYEDDEETENDEMRRTFKGMVSIFDESVGIIVDKMKEKGLWEDTLLLFASDNGGDPTKHGDNTPLRGAKGYLWEGGSHVPAMAHGNLVEKVGYTNHEFMHVSDWYNTIVAAVGGEQEEGIDSINQLETIRTGAASARDRIIYNSNLLSDMPVGSAAIRIGDYKLIRGDPRMSNLALSPDFQNDPTLETQIYDTPSHNIKELFNLAVDIEEQTDIAEANPDIVAYLEQELDKILEETVPSKPMNSQPSAAADPANFDNIWSTGWC